MPLHWPDGKGGDLGNRYLSLTSKKNRKKENPGAIVTKITISKKDIGSLLRHALTLRKKGETKEVNFSGELGDSMVEGYALKGHPDHRLIKRVMDKVEAAARAVFERPNGPFTTGDERDEYDSTVVLTYPDKTEGDPHVDTLDTRQGVDRVWAYVVVLAQEKSGLSVARTTDAVSFRKDKEGHRLQEINNSEPVSSLYYLVDITYSLIGRYDHIPSLSSPLWTRRPWGITKRNRRALQVGPSPAGHRSRPEKEGRPHISGQSRAALQGPRHQERLRPPTPKGFTERKRKR